MLRLELHIEVPPSSASPEQTTEASKALGESLLECAEEYKDRIPEGLFLTLNNLAKVEHECVPYEVLRRSNAALAIMGEELHSHKEHVEQLEINKKLRENVTELLRKRLHLVEMHNTELKEQLLKAVELAVKRKTMKKSDVPQTRYNLRQGVAGVAGVASVAGKRKR